MPSFAELGQYETGSFGAFIVRRKIERDIPRFIDAFPEAVRNEYHTIKNDVLERQTRETFVGDSYNPPPRPNGVVEKLELRAVESIDEFREHAPRVVSQWGEEDKIVIPTSEGIKVALYSHQQPLGVFGFNQDGLLQTLQVVNSLAGHPETHERFFDLANATFTQRP